MADITFEEVIKLARQLKPEEQQQLIHQLQHEQVEPQAPQPKAERSEAVKQVRRKAYAKARRYWESVGDMVKAAMTDEELDEQFGAFDEEGIPRLKSELTTLEPRPGTLAYAAMIAKKSRLNTGRPDLASRSDEYLEEWLAEDLKNQEKAKDEE